MRLLVHSDQAFRRDECGRLWTGRAFTLFLERLAEHLDFVTIAGRLEPGRERWHHPVATELGFCALPAHRGPLSMLAAVPQALARFWRALDDADAVWLLGPNLLTLPFALLARLRSRPVVLGVRQDLPEYLRNRHPGRRARALAGHLLEAQFRLLAKRRPVVAVGPVLAARYRAAPDLLEVFVSLIDDDDIADRPPAGRAPGDERRVLTVTRLDAEKNPLLLADVLLRLGPGWRLTICGDGPMRDAVEQRLRSLGVADRAELVGYVPAGAPLRARYRAADAFLHVSWTEGLPQVLFEAFAAGLPTVATAVGGVPAGAGDAALLVAPGDADAAAGALTSVLVDDHRRIALSSAGLRHARAHTLGRETRSVADFLTRHAHRAVASSIR